MKPNALRSDESGQSLVEFASIATILFFIVFGIFEFGRAFYSYGAIVNAASEGARYGSTNPDLSNGFNCVKKAAVATIFALNVPTSTVSVACPSGCSFGAPISVTVVYTFTAVTPYVPDIPMSGNSTMNILHAPNPPNTCP